MYRHAIADMEEKLFDRVKVCAELTNEKIAQKLTLLESIAIDPMVEEAVREGAELAREPREDGETPLVDRSISELEAAFEMTKLLQPSQRLNDRLRDWASVGDVSEIVVTERHGFNVGYTQTTSDFVQQDETWWQASQQQEQWVGVPSFDRSTDIFSWEFSGSIVDRSNGEFLGVIKLGYPVENYLNVLINTLRNLGFMESEVLQILDTKTGGTVMATLTFEGRSLQTDLVGEEAILQRALVLAELADPREQLDELTTKTFVHDRRTYVMAKIPATNWVAISSIELAQVHQTGRTLIVQFILLFVIVEILAIVIVLKFANPLIESLSDLTQACKKLTSGDLQTRVKISGAAEIESLGETFNTIVEWLEEILGEQQIWREKTVDLLQELQQMAVSIQSVATSVQTVQQEVNDANRIVLAGDDFMSQTVERIESIEESVSEAANQLQRLQMASGRIAQGVGLVKALAERSNLLALNASVEAARAGEQGQEFAVVAKEMRDLAQQSAQVTQEIDRLVGEIHRQTEFVSTAIREGRDEALSGKESVHRTQQELTRITTATDSISQLVREIAQATQSQASTSNFLSHTISKMVRE